MQNVLKRANKDVVKTSTGYLQGCNSVKRFPWYNNHLRKKTEGCLLLKPQLLYGES